MQNKNKIPTPFDLKHKLISSVIVLCLGLYAIQSNAQGTSQDNGHAESQGKTIFSAWNFDAGRAIPKDFDTYPEFLPNLQGWDFRINLPSIRFQPLSPGAGSAPKIVGVVEGDAGSDTMDDYGHINNALWIFKVFASDRKMNFKVLPSRRNFDANTVDNATSLTEGWSRITGPNLNREQPAAMVTGQGVDKAMLFLAARAENNELHFTQQKLNVGSDTSWPQSWTPLGIVSASAPAIAPLSDEKLALAWRVPQSHRIRVKVLTLANNTWSDAVDTRDAATGRPQLHYDGSNLNLFYVQKSSGLLKHSLVHSDTSPTIEPAVTALSLLSVKNDDFDIMHFNERLHAVIRQDAGQDSSTRLFYSSTRTRSGVSPQWAKPSEVGFSARAKPEISYLNNNIFVIGIGNDGRVRYARKDPNRRGNNLTGGALSDRWLQSGTSIDTLSGFSQLDSISFNSDIYLAGHRFPFDDIDQPSTQIMNFSRATMKRLLSDEHGIRLLWGEPGGGSAVLPNNIFANFEAGQGRHPFLPKSGDIPLIGDFDGDGKDDLIKFPQRKLNDTDGPAPVFVSIARSDTNFSLPSRWHRFFSLKGEIPLVGDFDGDGKDDIITFTQTRQHKADGSVLGNAPVWVALSDGTQFGRSRVWHTFFSLKGEIPMVGDFNGDGKDDIASFSQQRQHNADGTILGNAPVWVALSDGNKFQRSRVWHNFFSLKGELPLVGDFNGDGKDDIVSFVQKRQHNADGTILGNAPIWVALSDGRKFQRSQVWHTFFSLKGEIPRIGDLNLDGRDDIVTFVHDQTDVIHRNRNVYVSFSSGRRFDRATIWHSNFAADSQLPLIGSSSGITLADISSNTADSDKRIPSIVGFGAGGAVHMVRGLRNVPMPSGAPWEHYKWFNEKGLGTAMFPEWIWNGPQACLAPDHRFALLGAAGSGGGSLTNHSVRIGGREAHVLQEVGHSIFANCFRENNDPFNLWNAIFNNQAINGQTGFDANIMAFCPSLNSIFDCRDPEHYFLGQMVKYRVAGDDFRALIASSPNPLKLILQRQYNWLQAVWFEGTEFKTGAESNANFAEVGLQLLPDGPPPVIAQ